MEDETEFAKGLDTGYKRDRGVRDDFRNFGLCLWGAVIYLKGESVGAE